MDERKPSRWALASRWTSCRIKTGSMYRRLHGNLHELSILHRIPWHKPTETQSYRQGKHSSAKSICCPQDKELVTLSWLLSILHIAVCIPCWWLAGKTHELARYDWVPMLMGRVIDTLNDAIGEIHKTPALILDEKYLMAIFDEYLHELPPFKKYWVNCYQRDRCW